ncbi:hypothetical protein [Streptomyces sp. NPDC020965]|uniref:hypothetical protein n=1 Tax=Streptomyces sp. NPDC020965 TaxID=3365105 RepID=UPI0037A0ADDB
MTAPDECAECERLRTELDAATRAGDESAAVDCRVLLRRHPHHGDRPVQTEEVAE